MLHPPEEDIAELQVLAPEAVWQRLNVVNVVGEPQTVADRGHERRHVLTQGDKISWYLECLDIGYLEYLDIKYLDI